jgi:predicted Zn-dependent protease with MMP-like domain
VKGVRVATKGLGFAVAAVAFAALLGAAVFELIAGLGSGWLRIPSALVLAACAFVVVRVVRHDRPTVSAEPAPPRKTPVESIGFAGVADPELEAIVARTVNDLPHEFREQLTNLAFVIEEEPPPGKSWLATYQGIPLTEKSVMRPWDWPHKITIYRVPLRRLYGADPEEFQREVAHTVRHELAHYFGISDERLVELGAY